MIVDGKYYDGVTPQSAVEILQGLSLDDQAEDTVEQEDSE